MLQYIFRLSETFFQISTPKAEKTSRVKCDIKPQPWAVLTSWYRAHAMHRARSARSAWGSKFLGSICLWQAWLLPEISWKFDHWNYPIVREYIFPFSNLVFFFAYAEDIRLFLRPKCKDGVVRCGQSYWQLEAEGFGRCLRYASRAKKHNCLNFNMILVSFAVQLSVSQNQSLTLSNTLWFRSCFAS